MPGRGYTQRDWGEADVPPLADQELASARPFAEVFPEFAESIRRSMAGRPKSDSPKKAISIRLDQEVIAKFKATGAGWQSRINDVLKHPKV